MPKRHDTTLLATLGAERAELVEKLEANRGPLHDEILIAHHSGMSTVQIAKHAGMTRDGVLRIVKNAQRVRPISVPPGA